MKRNINYKLILLLIVPILVSKIIGILTVCGIRLNFSILLNIADILLSLWPFVSIFFWFYVGKQFGSLKMNKVKSFILGNIIWGISIILYIWQFIFVDAGNRNVFIAVISQDYMLGFVRWGFKIARLFTDAVDGNIVTIISYAMMLIVFTAGFINASIPKYEKKYY
ncbi:hypothetical protein [Tissierella praeacuta]|uniref:hypothetical protein n=1 Tax=Tissierella praeacuta TaxID=43131 RepID=UPI00333EB52F